MASLTSPADSAAPRAQPDPVAAAIEVERLVKRYTGVRAVDDVSFSVAGGEVFALLGPNGAGKTTTVEILSTLIPADAGTVRVAGHDVATEPDAVRAAIGVTGQFSAVDNLLTGQENLTLMADLHHLGRAAGRRRVAERPAQSGRRDRRLGWRSHGRPPSRGLVRNGGR